MERLSANIISSFLEAAAANPGAIALIQDRTGISYGQLLQEIEKTASGFRGKGIGAGDKVLVFVPMSPDLYRIVLALFYIGACPVFLDEWVSLERLKLCLKVVPCKALIAGTRHLALAWFVPALRRIPVKLRMAAKAQAADAAPAAPVSEADTALVTFTTGSTGIPKAADRTHAFLHAQLRALNPLLENIDGPCLTLLPIVVLLHLARGRTALLPPRKFKAAKPATIAALGQTIATRSPRAIIGSPAILDLLIDWQMHAGAPKTIGAVLTGGGPVYPDLAARMQEAFPGAHITAVYGSTESEPISHIDSEALAETGRDTMLSKGLPVGLPDISARVRILRPEANSITIGDMATLEANLMPAGTPGEIIVSGDHVLRHYINNPEAEAAVKIRIGNDVWHRTGDCGRFDELGQLYLLGRVSEVIDWNGMSLYPAILNYLLKLEAGIAISAFIRNNAALMLVLEKKDSPKAGDAIAALKKQGISGATIRCVGAIPRDPRHRTKVDYPALRKLLD
jgi:acyl-CoA synthetase (AMP-forming)/AMP-acid ligase II